MKRKYEQHYRPEWEKNPLFSAWLCKCREDSYSAFCKACNTKILPRMASIKEHSNSAKHNKNMIGFSGSSQVSFSFIFILYILVILAREFVRKGGTGLLRYGSASFNIYFFLSPSMINKNDMTKTCIFFTDR